jgi:hypothetical protein
MLLQDSAPDIYETPELTDDNSTAPVSMLPLFENSFSQLLDRQSTFPVHLIVIQRF